MMRRIFYMDPGFSVPDISDLLELDNDSGKNLIQCGER